MFSPTDTIVAIATPSGRGGLGVVRLSGPRAHEIALALLGRAEPLEVRHATFARVRAHGDGHGPLAVDQVVATRFVSPQSFTGDDTVELTGHGSPVLLREIVGMAIDAGARLAEPGEFTFRAYLNGRLDLVQAEAIADLIDAVTPLQARAAMDQLEGTLTSVIQEVDASLFDLAARLEASLDFPEEGFHFVSLEGAARELAEVRHRLEGLIEAGESGRMIREGSTVAIIGRPNVGKSSLFNALVGNNRAIVTDVPGTTRDLVTERVDIGGLAVTLVDTAGLRTTGDVIELEGVARARDARRVATLTLLVFDSSEPFTIADREMAQEVLGRHVVVLSKCDLPSAWASEELLPCGSPMVSVSARSGHGLARLRTHIVQELTGQDALRDPPAISNIRHVRLVRDAASAVGRAEEALTLGVTEEVLLLELGGARRALEEITGRRSPDDLLRHIFGRFCIGK